MTKKYEWACMALVCGSVACGSEDPVSPSTNNPLNPVGGAAGNIGGGGAPVGAGGAIGTGGSTLPPGMGGMPMGGTPGAGGDTMMPPMGGMTGMGGSGSGGMGTAGDTGAGGDLGAGGDGAGGMGAGGDGAGGMSGDGTCCSDGDCLCHGDPPSSLTSDDGPFQTDSYTLAGYGCVYYPTDAEPPFAAVTISDGFLGSGGCGLAQTGLWGPLYASWGIVAMVVDTTGADQPPTRGQKLLRGIEGFKAENGNSSSKLYQKLSGRYGTSGFSMGGGGTTYASSQDSSLLSSVAMMPWGPTSSPVTVPTLVICGASDGIAPCASHGTPFYGRLGGTVPKIRVQVSGGHNGQPTAGGGESGEWGLAFTKAFLEGDERWLPLLTGGRPEDSANIQ